MALLVVAGASCACTFGASPSTLIIPPANKVLACSKPAGNIMDNKPTTNIPPFGMCSSLSNPQVASATAAALGVLTPMPCVPFILAPWAPGSSSVIIGGKPALSSSCKCSCNWGGVISISNPGQSKVKVP